MIAAGMRIPWRPSGGHFDDTAADTPHVTGAAVVLAPQNLWRHKGECALQLAGELALDGGGGAELGCRAEVADTQSFPSRVDE